MFEHLESGKAVFQNEDIDEEVIKANLQAEAFMGATNAATSMGNGRLSVGISPWGELIYFRWPSPSYYDHLRYFTFSNLQGFKSLFRSIFWKSKPVRMIKEAPNEDFKRHGRPYEPYPDIGSRPGVLTGSGDVLWANNPEWKVERSYISESSPILETRYHADDTSFKVRDWVDPKRDVMVRKFNLGPGVNKLFYHNTFQPSMTHPAEKGLLYPITIKSMNKGFAAVYHPREDLITHFYPKNPRDDEEVRKVLKGGCSPRKLDKLFPEGGIFITWGFRNGNDEIQIGADRSGNRIKKDHPIGGKDDADDGKLDGNRSYIGPVDSSIGFNRTSNSQEATMMITVGANATEAVSLFKKSQGITGRTLRRRATKHWKDISENIRVPEEADEVTRRVVKRSIMNVIQSQDKDSGAIVASNARQPTYHFDWPRDGAFFDLALDLAGFPDLVDKHLDFYKKTQLKEDRDFNPLWLLGLRSPIYKPKGHWHPNMTADGKNGYMRSVPFEIDETGLTLWNIWRHEKFLPESKKYEYREKFKPVIIDAAEGIMNHVSRKKGQLWEVFEDDDRVPKATLHGKTSVLTGLCAAADAGARWGIRGIKVAKWGNVAKKMRKNILDEVMGGSGLEKPGWRGVRWSVWPAPLFDWTESNEGLALVERLFSEIREKVSAERLGVSYLGEQLWCLSIAVREDDQRRQFLKDVLREFTHNVPVPGTDCYGELALHGNLGPGENIYQNRTSIPHLWNGTTAYLATLGIYQPEIFDELRPPKPEDISP